MPSLRTHCTRRKTIRHLTVCVAVIAAVGGCASTQTVPVRASTQPEAARAFEALLPLMQKLNYPLASIDPPSFRDGCRLGLVVIRSPAINAGVRPGRRSPCVHFTLVLTEAAANSLTVPQLRAVLAHELGHVHLGHFSARQERADAGGPANVWLLRQRYDRQEELAADDFAVRLLQSLEPDYPGSCLALVSVLETLAARGAYATDWLSSHPSPDRRAQRAQAACNGKAGR